MKKLLSLFITLHLVSFSTSSHAEDLLQIYKQARETNPELLKALADRNSVFQGINIARSPLLPALDLKAKAKYNKEFRDSEQEGYSSSASLMLEQTIFDMAKWSKLNQAEKLASIADINYLIAQQKLTLDTANAYFDVLYKIDSLTYTEAQKASLYRQLDQATQRFNVGLSTITDVQSAQAQYDAIIAQGVYDSNDLINSLEKLRLITGIHYSQLASLNIENLKISKPEPVETILKEAKNANLSLLSARLMQDLKQEQVKEAQTGYMPTIILSANTDIDNRHQRNGTYKNEYTGGNSANISLSLPLYSGGSTSSKTSQAKYNSVSSAHDLENTYRKVIQNVRSSYNDITASISKIEANKQTVISAESSLNAMEAGYQVGTRTIVDVLNATTKLYQAKRGLSQARYSYLLSLLVNRQARGNLNEKDIFEINNMLGRNISTSVNSIIKEIKTPTTY
ncbi:outer membrane channel protein TolC [Xenorhabdus khoisanae]|uniref:outer membrane channel protein TolC n=1 Tax=Xenorhabdus khoisanae TaxID=880157 RepID=UPI002358F5CA|nr:outer membrane channel protein TolC [Xenorhabdus khoisanae]MDC9616361.1 outer membrane channel protein TolC [Xenorhabdus khoisanae]